MAHDDSITPAKSHHVAIAGTGRSGTSFLVRYLTALGLDTTLARSPDSTDWDDTANAGYEENLAGDALTNMPYYVKSPWLFASIDRVLSRPDIAFDGVIIPMRDLVEASASRAILERQEIHNAAPWMAAAELNWEIWGSTPGGIIYSLNPIDQARLLAVGFHKLVEGLVTAEVPIVFLSFPRLTEDSAYLYRSLRPLLPSHVTESQAAEALRGLADTTKVRVGGELSAGKSLPAIKARRIDQYPSQQEIDVIALRREVTHLRRELAKQVETFKQIREKSDLEAVSLKGEHDRTVQELDRTAHERDRAAQELDRTVQERDRAVLEIKALREQLAHAQQESRMSGTEVDELRTEMQIIRQSNSWRLTQPLRAIMTLIRRPPVPH